MKTYAEGLAQFHLRPEHKFRNGDYTDRGITIRRHVVPLVVRQIGKESNRWEERFFLGGDDGLEVDYGIAADLGSESDSLRARVIAAGQRHVARKSGVARRTIERLLSGNTIRPDIRQRIVLALSDQL